MSHAEFLRDNWDNEDATDKTIAIVRALMAAGDEATRLGAEEGLGRVSAYIGQLELDGQFEPGDAELLEWVARLTLAPRLSRKHHLEAARRSGLSDELLHDVVHVVANFAYMNRLADGLGVTLLEHKSTFATQLLGAEALQRHMEWGS